MKDVKKVLVVIDMQNDFIDGALGTPEAQAIVPNVAKKIEECKSNGYDVIFTRDTHDVDYLLTNEGKHLPVEHCVKYTNGWEIHNGLSTAGAQAIVNKKTFGYVDWEMFLELDFYTDVEIELVGLCTDICVISNAMILKATFPEAKISVDASCCAGVTPESHENALKAMEMCQIEVINR